MVKSCRSLSVKLRNTNNIGRKKNKKIIDIKWSRLVEVCHLHISVLLGLLYDSFDWWRLRQPPTLNFFNLSRKKFFFVVINNLFVSKTYQLSIPTQYLPSSNYFCAPIKIVYQEILANEDFSYLISNRMNKIGRRHAAGHARRSWHESWQTSRSENMTGNRLWPLTGPEHRIWATDTLCNTSASCRWKT